MGKNDDKQLQVALVTNADEMLWALKSSKDMDMEIRSHFSVELMDMWEAQTHRSMRGNCTEPVPKELIRHLDGPDLLPMKPGQCLLVTDQPILLPMEIYETPIWIDNMYIRVGNQASLKNPGGLTLLDATKMYLTNVTLQGDGTTDSRASDGQYATLFGKTRTFYARDITIANICGWTYNKWSQGPALAFTSSKSYANITNTQFLNNACPKGAPPSNPRYPQMRTGGLEVDHVSISACGEALIECEDVHIALENVEFSRQDSCEGQCPPDVELAGYLWDPTDAPRLNDQNADDLFGAPIYYADRSMPIACPHCGETSSDVNDGMGGWPMPGPAPPEWDDGIESDVAASLNPNGVSVPPTWLAAQSLAAIPGRVARHMPTADDPVFAALVRKWQNPEYKAPTKDDVTVQDDFGAYGMYEGYEGSYNDYTAVDEKVFDDYAECADYADCAQKAPDEPVITSTSNSVSAPPENTTIPPQFVVGGRNDMHSQSSSSTSAGWVLGVLAVIVMVSVGAVMMLQRRRRSTQHAQHDADVDALPGSESAAELGAGGQRGGFGSGISGAVGSQWSRFATAWRSNQRPTEASSTFLELSPVEEGVEMSAGDGLVSDSHLLAASDLSESNDSPDDLWIPNLQEAPAFIETDES